ncbi:MAG: Fic family protein [Chitinophagaceae bacterium]
MEIINIINDLNKELQKLGKLSESQEEALKKKIRLEFNYNSNHLEGNTLTYAETELLLIFDETRGSHSGREYEEMKASDVALKMVEDLAKEKSTLLTETFIKNLNNCLLVRPYLKDAINADGTPTKKKISIGEYKKLPNSVLLSNGETFEYASPIETPALMGDLINWLREAEEKKQLHPVEIAAELHYKFVRIHPFDDGNGRVSRLLMNYILIKNNYPPIIIKSEDKKNYLAALHDADTGNISSFKTYIAQQLIPSLELSIRAALNEDIEDVDDWKKQLTLIKRELSNKETIKIVQSPNALQALINDVILKLGLTLLHSLPEFDELFLRKSFIIDNGLRKATTINNETKIDLETIHTSYYNNIILKLLFIDFSKDADNPFSITIEIELIFHKHKYEMYLDKKFILKKLYHQNYSEVQVKELTNQIGKLLTENIKSKISI